MDKKHLMRKAFDLAKKGKNLTGLNPMVGAIILKSGKIIGRGFHSQYGGPHAEVNAIADAESRGFNVKGSTLISSLEPCCHTHKKTPPCTDLLIEKGIKTLYYGSVDLNPKVKGKGIKKLEKNNIETIFVDYQDINDELNRGALNIIRKNRPFVTLKICMTLDGMIYNKKTKNGSIGDSEQLEHSNNLRKMHDSVLVGVETIIKDNPKQAKEDLERVYEHFPRIKIRRKSQAGFTSGGEQQMIAMGRALMGRPKLILLDEPSMGLAPQLVEEIFEIVKALNKEGVSFLVAEQNAMVALKYADEGYIIENGRVILKGSSKELLDRPDVKELYLGTGDKGRTSFRDIKYYHRRKPSFT